jgi:hypothetical protein
VGGLGECALEMSGRGIISGGAQRPGERAARRAAGTFEVGAGARGAYEFDSGAFV